MHGILLKNARREEKEKQVAWNKRGIYQNLNKVFCSSPLPPGQTSNIAAKNTSQQLRLDRDFSLCCEASKALEEINSRARSELPFVDENLFIRPLRR